MGEGIAEDSVWSTFQGLLGLNVMHYIFKLLRLLRNMSYETKSYIHIISRLLCRLGYKFPFLHKLAFGNDTYANIKICWLDYTCVIVLR